MGWFLYHVHTSVHTTSIHPHHPHECVLFLFALFLFFIGTYENPFLSFSPNNKETNTEEILNKQLLLSREEKGNGTAASCSNLGLKPSTHLSNWEIMRDLPAAGQCQGLVLWPALKGRCTFCCCSAGVQTDTADVRRWTQAHNLKITTF